MSNTGPGQSDQLASCDLEPIHVPGAIQAHGVLLVLSEPELIVLQTSANSAQILGVPSDALLGQSLARWLHDRSRDILTAALRLPRLGTANPLRLELAGRVFDGICHRYLGNTILELEPMILAGSALSGQLRAALDSLQSCSTLDALCQVAVEEVRRSTGFDRVMVYRFDHDDHGCVVAEAKKEELSPYLGLHYPASDIPRQARALYLLNWLRIIPDVGYSPVIIQPTANLLTKRPLDQSFSILRSVSPIHIQYLKNMGIAASM